MKTLPIAFLLLFLFAGNASAMGPRGDPNYRYHPSAERCGQAHAVLKCRKVWRHGKRVKVCHRVPC